MDFKCLTCQTLNTLEFCKSNCTVNCSKCTLKHYISHCSNSYCCQEIIDVNNFKEICKTCLVCNYCSRDRAGFDGRLRCLTCIKRKRNNLFNIYMEVGIDHKNIIAFDTSRKVYELSEELNEQKQLVKTLTEKLNEFMENMNNMLLYHPVIGSEIPKISQSFKNKAENNEK